MESNEEKIKTNKQTNKHTTTNGKRRKLEAKIRKNETEKIAIKHTKTESFFLKRSFTAPRTYELLTSFEGDFDSRPTLLNIFVLYFCVSGDAFKGAGHLSSSSLNTVGGVIGILALALFGIPDLFLVFLCSDGLGGVRLRSFENR